MVGTRFMVGTRSRAIRVGTPVELIVGEGRARLRPSRGLWRRPRLGRSLALPRASPYPRLRLVPRFLD
jgi:hypothetical protein